jgi:xyloglucan:xyloglucosyl transferase
MASLRAFLVALFIFAVAFDPSSVNAKFSKSMYFYWGAHNSAILGDGDNLQLVLNPTSGDDLLPIHQIIGFLCKLIT